MGLSGAIQKELGFESKVLSCPRCLTFWTVLIWSLLCGQGLLLSVAASFISAYSALWLCLVYDAVAIVYNKAYDKISAEDDTETTEADAVSEMQPKQ